MVNSDKIVFHINLIIFYKKNKFILYFYNKIIDFRRSYAEDKKTHTIIKNPGRVGAASLKATGFFN